MRYLFGILIILNIGIISCAEKNTVLDNKIIDSNNIGAQNIRTPEIKVGENNREKTIPFQGITLDDTSFHIDETLGTPTLMVFWAHW